MPDESQIRINALLLEREALFVRVHEIERATAAIFGEPFPFERPTLPSDYRSKRKPAKRAGKAKAGGGPSNDKLRKLDEGSGETAYRVTYLQQGQSRSEVHDSPDGLNTLLAAQGTQLQVVSIETIEADGTTVSVLLGDSTANTA